MKINPVATENKNEFQISCPAPLASAQQILMSHGGGGTAMHQLIEKIFIRHFDNPILKQRHDAAVIPLLGGRLSFTTDTYVVRPIFFPGGDIGALAVHGTVNDLAMA